jgi:hypothetical protein
MPSLLRLPDQLLLLWLLNCSAYTTRGTSDLNYKTVKPTSVATQKGV